jgi:hypothetical protein
MALQRQMGGIYAVRHVLTLPRYSSVYFCIFQYAPCNYEYVHGIMETSQRKIDLLNFGYIPYYVRNNQHLVEPIRRLARLSFR